MQLFASKIVALCVILIMAAIGSLLAIRLAKVSLQAMQCCNCFAGGVLIVVAIVDMLPDNAPELENMGQSIANALGADEPFPIGNVFLIVGFLLIPIIEASLGIEAHKHSHSDGESHDVENGNAGQMSPVSQLAEPLESCPQNQSWLQQATALADAAVRPSHNLTLRSDPAQTNPGSTAPASFTEHMQRAQKVNNLSVSAAALLVGLLIHAVVEGLAMGAAQDVQSVVFILIATACHKGFAAFALGSALLPLWNAGQEKLWLFLNLLFALAGAVGILIGALFSVIMNGVGVAILSCVAAGTLLNIGICEMLIPALADPIWRRRKVMITMLSSFCMALLVAWA